MSLKRKKSEIWNFFSVEDNNKAKCNICKSTFSYKTSVTNLKSHITRKHPSIKFQQTERIQGGGQRSNGGECEQEQPRTSKESEGIRPDPSSLSSILITTDSEPSTSKASSVVTSFRQQSISTYVPRKISLSLQKRLDQLLLGLIIKDFQPFSLVEDKGFREFVTTLNSGYKLPTRKTLSNVLLPAVYEEIRLKVSDILKDVTSVTVTTDCWTSRNIDSVMAVTIHFIDSHFKIKSVLLECVEYEGGHGSENLSQNLRKVITDWNISENNVLLGISDNAANIRKAISVDLKWRHFGCYAHTLNLIVGDSLKLIQDTLDKVSKIVTYFRKSANAKNKLDTVQQQQDKAPKKLIKDVPTRWNSTYLMLKRFLELEEAIRTTLVLTDAEFLPVISTEEWKFMKE